MTSNEQSILVAELRDECEDDTVCDYLARVAAAVIVETHELHGIAANMDLARDAEQSDRLRLATAILARDAEQSDRLRLATAILARSRLNKLNLPAALREEGESLLLPIVNTPST